MVKYPVTQSNSSSPKIRIPLKVIIFWYKKISSYINSKNISSIENKECPTLYISKKYPRMSILELYERISHHLSKYFPNIYNKLNANTNKKCLIKLKKIRKEINGKNKETSTKPKNDNKTKKNLYVLISGKKNKSSEKIRHINEKNCKNIKHLFESHKFDEDILEKYNNCTIKEILLTDDKKESIDDNGNDNDNESSSSNIDNISPCKSTSSNSSSSLNFNKINFLTHFQKAPKKSKYFINDDYFSNKLKSIGNYNKK